MQLSEDFVLLWLASGQDFQNTLRPPVPYFSYIVSQSVHVNQFIKCYLVPDHQEVVKYLLEFTMIISTTARQRSHSMQIITYRVG